MIIWNGNSDIDFVNKGRVEIIKLCDCIFYFIIVICIRIYYIVIMKQVCLILEIMSNCVILLFKIRFFGVSLLIVVLSDMFRQINDFGIVVQSLMYLFYKIFQKFDCIVL